MCNSDEWHQEISRQGKAGRARARQQIKHRIGRQKMGFAKSFFYLHYNEF
jgi:hypothetical protein